MIAGYSFSIDHREQKKINSMTLGWSSSPRESEIFHTIAPLHLTPVHDVFNILMNEKILTFPRLWQHNCGRWRITFDVFTGTAIQLSQNRCLTRISSV